jgi:hypothetical protein
MFAGDHQIHRRHHEQRERRADRQPACDHDAHVDARHRAGAACGDQRDDAEHHGGHQDWAQVDRGGFLDCGALRAPLGLQMIGELPRC